MNTSTDLQEIVAAHRLVGFDDVYWNLGQVVAWAETRSPFPVDALSDATIELARRDHSMVPEQPHFAAEFADRCADENGLPRTALPFKSSEDARLAVSRSFQSGAMTASGHRSISLTREPISVLEWAALTIADTNIGEMVVRHREGDAAGWYDVRAPRDEVLKCFPANSGVSSSKENAAAVDSNWDDQPPAGLGAGEEGLPVRPPEGAFDPDKLSHWSIAMTMAWIIWGDIGAVREQWDDYRTQCAEWKFFPEVVIDRKTHEAAIKHATYQELAPHDPEMSALGGRGEWKFVAWNDAGWLGLEFECRRDDLPWEEMVDELWQAAGEGRIQATAVEFGDQKAFEVVEIPAHMWTRLRRTREPSGRAMLSAPDRDYRDIRFARSDVKALWPLRAATEDASQVMLLGNEARPAQAQTNNRRGRPKEYNWDDVRDFALDLVGRFGVPGEGNKKLPRNEDLVKAIQDEWATKKDIHLADSTVRRYVSKWLAEL
ncbi:hypothetical protein ACVWW4_004957 [Bradyrhizobium sp. LB7.1]